MVLNKSNNKSLKKHLKIGDTRRIKGLFVTPQEDPSKDSERKTDRGRDQETGL